jgi:superfamily II DNA or RNA helicase
VRLRNVVHKDDIGMFCSGSMPDGNLVCIGNMQSVSTPTKPKFEEIKITWRQACQHMLKIIEKEKLQELKELMPERLAVAIYDKPEGMERLTHTTYAKHIIERIRQQSFRNRMQWFKTRYYHAKEIQDYIRQCDLCLVDEADLAVSQPYSILFRSFFHGRRKYGFTGTPFDKTKPVQNITLKENLGSIIYEVPREQVQEAGRIIPVKCYFIPIGTNGDKKDTRALDIAQKEDIIENEAFHNKVIKLNESFKNERNLIVVDTNPIESLGLALEQKIPNSKFLYGKISKPERREYIKMFENNRLQCLIAGKILKRGFDLNGGCDNLIIIGGGKQWSNINQIVGRAIRLNKRGWARIFLFFSLSNKYLYSHSRENLKAIVDLGYPTKMIYNGKMIDAEIILKSRFRLPSK